MELENFKSYAGVQCIGPFHHSFSAIVGPNGSGKSNVIDAMLFVFGKRAKKLRLSKVSELIHQSSQYKDLEFARVTVFFEELAVAEGEHEEEGGAKPIDGSAFSISRVAYRDNSSKYLVNEKKSNFTEVTSLLRSKGVDLDHNRFLILQGEVESIALMKPKGATEHEEGFLEWLEDLIGSNQFVKDIEEASSSLDEVNEQRLVMVDRVKSLEKEKEGLETAKNEAESYLVKEKEVHALRHKLVQCEMLKVKKHAAKKEMEKSKVEVELKAETQKLSETTEAMSAMEKDFQTAKEEYDVILATLEQCKKDFQVFERKDVKFREDIKHDKQKIRQFENAIAQDKRKLEADTRQLEEDREKIETTQKDLDALQPQIRHREAELDRFTESLESETREFRRQIEEKHKERVPWQQEIDQGQQKISLAKAEVDLVTDRQTRAREELHSIDDRLAEVIKEEKENEKAVKTGSKRKSELSMVISKLTKELERLKETEERTSSSVKKVRVVLETAKMGFESSKSSSFARAMDAVLKAGRAGTLPGVIGRLGDLGTIDSKYDVAISTACGPALDFVVVENSVGGKRCVEFLKKHNLGRLTFVMMDRIRNVERKVKDASECPLPRLVDLVEPSRPEYRPAFFFALGSTLVAKDIEEASTVAYGKQRRRVVSLNGDLIDVSGAMTGGGAKRRGGMARKASGAEKEATLSPEAIKEKETELQDLMQKLRDDQEMCRKTEEELLRAKSELDRLAFELPKLEMKLESLALERKGLEQRKVEIEPDLMLSSAEEKRVAELKESISLGSRALEKAQRYLSELDDAIVTIEKQIDDVGGVELRKKKFELESAMNEVGEANRLLARLKASVKTLEKNITKRQDDLEKKMKEKAETEAHLEETKTEFKRLEDDAYVVMQKYEEIQKIHAERTASLEEIEKDYRDSKAMVDELKVKEVELTQRYDDARRTLAAAEEKVKSLQKDLTKLEKILRSDGEESSETVELLSEDELANMDSDSISDEIATLQTDLKKMKPNMAAIRHYLEKEEDYRGRCTELESLTQKRKDSQQRYDDLRKERLDVFMKGFEQITLKLKEMYQMITLGGDAELELVDSLDPFSEGIVFSVRPAKKTWKNIRNLSGGEKTLASLALVFALHHYKPTPIYVMDEIDAALDFRNVSIVANYVKDRTKDAQFVVISLRNNMFELADRLVGVYKTDDATKSVTIDPKAFALAGTQTVSTRPQQLQGDGREEEEDEKEKGKKK
eukprot:TRINITY_DN2186_c0_g1_i1.p1 TRINITY_DN2186_c0_g1~~TRINITY_DN2186_c0_g1_i1.p1  ORF type:complete len:1295 (-),score=482.64 TRINITY_DN2186_c0_g1_i1:277-3999(-)